MNEGSLLFLPRRAWLFRVPIPLSLSPRIEAENLPVQSGGWRVRVRFAVPLLGQIAEYEGKMMTLD